MSSNSAQMTLEQKLVQHLKEDTLGKLIGDEDAMTALVERAVKEALFQPRRASDTDGWRSSVKELDSPVVEAARKFADKIADQLVTSMLAEPETRRKLHNAMVDMLPAAIEKRWAAALTGIIQEAQLLAVSEIRTMKQAGQL